MDGIVYIERELSVSVCLKVYVGGVKVGVTAKLFLVFVIGALERKFAGFRTKPSK